MNAPNPASVFGCRQSPRTPESSVTPAAVFETQEPHKDDEAAQTRRVMDGQLGNGELPIAAYREQIVDAVDASQATLAIAETGAGKSTQVPQFLAEAGYEVILTQPRVVAARTLSERIRDEIVAKRGPEYADFVGYRTARERQDSPENRILTVTDGLQLVRELSGNGVGKKQVLVADEVHEWNENMEVLVAWAKKHMVEDPDFKVVVMSATMEAGPLAHYFADGGKREVPVIEVPGRTFEVKKEEGGDVADEAIKFARDGKNTLVFVPGEAEIKQVMAEVQRANIPNAVVLPLYGRLEKEEQQKAFKKYPGAKVIVATNVAQTSITIEDIDVVVDSGLERQKQVKNGVEGLYLNPISQADCLQRAGRAGRTKSGEYVLAQLGNNKLIPMAEREAYGTPEILRTRLDGMVLRLAKGGLDAAELEFYNVERQEEDVREQFAADIAKAKTRLQKLGALREDGSITKVGRDMDRMPVESHYARMMIEARQYGPEVQMQLAALLAVQEADGICQFDTKNRPCGERWRGLLEPNMNDSDAIKQLEVFVAAERMSNEQKRDHDIYVKAFSKSCEVLRQLRGVERLHDQDLSVPTKEQRAQLVKCIIAGRVDNMYINDGYYGHRNAQGDVREVSSRSIIRAEKMVVGTPFDLQINTRRGLTTLHLLYSPTNVPSVDVLRVVAPQLFSEDPRGFVIGKNGVVHEEFMQVFNGYATGELITRPAVESEARASHLARIVAEGSWYSDEVQNIMTTVQDLNNRMPGSVGIITRDNLVEVTTKGLPRSAASLDEAREYVPQFSLDDLVSAGERSAIYAASPDEFSGRTLVYKDGSPMLRDGLSEDDILALVADDLVLPDGRKIGLRSSWGDNPIDIAGYQLQIMANRKERAEAIRRQHERNVQKAVDYLEREYSREQVIDWYGEEVASEAQDIYRTRIEAAAAERERAETKRRDLGEQIETLLRDNEDMYSYTETAGIDDDTVPGEIRQELRYLRERLEDANSNLTRKHNRLLQGGEVALEADTAEATTLRTRVDVLLQRFKDWQQAEKERENRPVSGGDLAALMAHFNKH